MKYEFSKTYDQQKALEYLNKLIKAESKCEVKKINPRRSLSANRYIHVIIAIWAKEYGYFMDEAKQTIKHALNYYKVNDRGALIYDKTSEMSSADLSVFTDKFRDWSAINGLYLCTPDEYYLEQIYFDNLIDN